MGNRGHKQGSQNGIGGGLSSNFKTEVEPEFKIEKAGHMCYINMYGFLSTAAGKGGMDDGRSDGKQGGKG